MPAIGADATRKVVEMLAGATGLPFTVPDLARQENAELAPISPAQIVSENVAFEMAEKTAGVTYPAVYVYCDKLSNGLREKFRTFSGTASMAIEIRVSHERLERLARDLHLYAAAASGVLDSHRGDWDGGMFYTGGYEVTFGPVKRGGSNFLQTAKISFDVDVSY
jgi:hypothetical protein